MSVWRARGYVPDSDGDDDDDLEFSQEPGIFEPESGIAVIIEHGGHEGDERDERDGKDEKDNQKAFEDGREEVQLPSSPIPLDPSATDVGNFFPSSATANLQDISSSISHFPQSPSPDLALRSRRASVSSSDLSDVDMQILASSPHHILDFHFSKPAQAREQSVTPRPLPLLNQIDATAVPPAPRLSDTSPSGYVPHSYAAPLRNFRSRKAIQLHPYLLEQEKYRQALKARGYRPVQVATASQQRSRDCAHDTQELDFNASISSHTQETTPPDSSASPHQQTTTPHHPRPALYRLEDSDDDNFDFPDDRVAQHRHVIGGVQQGYKRRRTINTPHSLNPPEESTPATGGKLKPVGFMSRPAFVPNIPPSPPRTSSPLIVDPTTSTVPVFRRPRGLTPPPIHTPVPSSPPTRAVSSTRRLLELTDSESDQSSERNPSPDLEAEERQLRRMQKRLRGVLPASWLKLDQANQRKTSAPNLTSVHDTSSATGHVRGVAQRVTPAKADGLARKRASIVLSDASGDSDDSDASPQELLGASVIKAHSKTPRSQLQMNPFDDSAEVEEHDEIDRMFSTTQTSRRKKNQSKKQQSRLTDGFVRPTDRVQQLRRVPSTVNPTSHRRQEPHTERRERNPKPKVKQKRPVQLSILDVTSEFSSNKKLQPKFLRLAARQARKRPDLGRHSPTQKTVRLATHEDTLDALLPLQSWNDGKLRPSDFIDLTVDDPDSSDRISLSTSRTIRRALNRANLGTGRHDRSKSSDTPQRPSRRPPAPPKARSSIKSNGIRPAQLEVGATTLNCPRDFLTFAPPPSRLMQIFRRDRTEGAPSRFRLERFLQDKGDQDGSEDAESNLLGSDVVMNDSGDATAATVAPKRSRKRLARRMDVELRTFRQPDEPLPVETLPESVDIVSPETSVETLQGLGSFGVRYPTDFDVRPLEIGTYFHQNTFVGCGDFAKSLTFHDRDLDTPASRFTINVGGRTLSWSAWDEEISSSLETALRAITEQAGAMTDSEEKGLHRLAGIYTSLKDFLRSVVMYCSDSLYFTDPVDRFPCVARLSRFTDECYDILQDYVVRTRPHVVNTTQFKETSTDLLLYLLCISAQTVRLAQHPAVDMSTRGELAGRTVKFSRLVLASSLSGNFEPIRSFLEDHRQHSQREAGIRDDEAAVKSIVMVNHVLKSVPVHVSLSDILFDQFSGNIASCNIQILDRMWYDIFTVQPLLEIDSHGLFRPGSRYQSANDSWTPVKSLLQHLFKLYPASARCRNPTLNDYVRACLCRAYCLITRWGWHRCEPVLNVVYDFFAGNGFSQLQNEESKGSPHFLENLDKGPEIQLESRDTAFQIFLKTLVVGLQSLQAIYPKNKLRGFAWRFIPNHGRTYRKDQEITRGDIDALRNNHDLLCALYWALPRGSGPRLQMIKDLVDHTTSHREACRLSVHAWAMIARYQLSTGEKFDDLDMLAAWFKDMASVTMSQYRLAQSEVETQYATERAKGSTDITQEVVEATIACNQRVVFATLLDLLQFLHQAIRVSSCWEISHTLVDLSNLTDVFKLFDPDQPRLFAAIFQALDIIQTLHRAKPRSNNTESQGSSEDSQEYGDWSYLEEAVDQEDVHQTRPKMTEMSFVHDPLAILLSSSFGSDKSPDDDLLQKLVDVWTAVASELVKQKVHDWSNYLDAFSTNSWFQLRNTDQRRKYTAYYLSATIEVDKTALDKHRNVFLGTWFVSLLERESMLKFQHLLTNSLLNMLPNEPLLQNLPFASSGRTGRFDVTLADLRERRISLIGSILSNMLAGYANAQTYDRSSASLVKAEYGDILKQAMTFMRRSYEELQEISAAAGDSHAFTQGAYVSFVQHVISLMQQYTFDICKVDKFFVDSSVFPLPSNDPTYVVGRLKRYVFKLGEPGARKELAVFVQTVSERAAVDNEQVYLVDQLYRAMTGKVSDSLRHFLITTIFPTYLEVAQTTSCGWILALPLMEASTLVFADLIHDLDIVKGAMLNLSAITTMLQGLCQWAIQISEDPSLLAQQQNLCILRASFRAAQSSLTVVDYANRRTSDGFEAAKIICLFAKMARYLICVERGDENAIFPDVAWMPSMTASQHVDTASFSKKSLHDELNRFWVKRGEEYLVVRGNSSREVFTHLATMETERDSLFKVVEEFLDQYDVIFRRKLRGAAGTVAFSDLFI